MLWKPQIVALVVAAALFAAGSPLRAQTAPSTWPAQITTADGQVTIFQPQLDDFQADQLSSRAAVSVQLNGQQDPVFGAVWFHDDVAVDNAARTVSILRVSVADMRFPNADPTVQRAVQDAVNQFFGSRHVVLSLDQLQSTLDVLHKEQAAAGQIQVDAPKIVFRDHPAVKVQYDGPPRLMQVDNSPLFRVVNTPFFVALDPGSRTYFLKGGGRWFAAPDPMGPFQQVSTAPPAIAALADSSGYQDPQQPLNVDPNAPVEIVTASDPTELVWTAGPAQLGTIAGTNLLYVANTDADLFLTIDHPRYFVLLSGRWYAAPREGGPWAFVPPDQLPDDFRRIPPDSEKGGVLVSVPGTAAASDAVADSYVPQTAAVDINHFDQPPVSYDGDPNFQPVEGTPLTYAVNTDASVLNFNGQYYCCYNAVWYNADAAAGPWAICSSVPSVIYTLPPSCPIYPVRFCYIYGHGPGAVYFGYLPGYVGSYVYDGVVVYGTGFHYHPWLGHLYIARPYTFGFAAQYDWYTGHWGFDFALALGGGRGWVPFGVEDRFHGGWFGHGGFHPVYAHNRAEIAAADRRFGEDRDHHFAITSVYDRRADVRGDLAGGRPRPVALMHAAETARYSPDVRARVDRADDRAFEDSRTAERSGTDRAAADRTAVDRAAADRTAVDRAAADHAAADRAAADRTAADRAAADRSARSDYTAPRYQRSDDRSVQADPTAGSDRGADRSDRGSGSDRGNGNSSGNGNSNGNGNGNDNGGGNGNNRGGRNGQ